MLERGGRATGRATRVSLCGECISSAPGAVTPAYLPSDAGPVSMSIDTDILVWTELGILSFFSLELLLRSKSYVIVVCHLLNTWKFSFQWYIKLETRKNDVSMYHL